MKRMIPFLAIFFLTCTKQVDDRVIGTWDVQSKFYRGTYKIEKKDKKIIGKVLYYNDDTTVIRGTGTDNDIFLHDLKMKGGAFFDAISGATTHTENMRIKIKNNDTLEVVTYIKKKPLVEIWTRKK